MTPSSASHHPSRRRTPWRQPAALVVLLAGLLIATLVGAVATSLWSDRTARLASADAANERAVQLMEAHAGRTYQTARLLLAVVDGLLRDVRPGEPGPPLDALLASVSRVTGITDGIRIRLFDRNGRMLMTDDGTAAGFDSSERDYMRRLLAMAPTTSGERPVEVGAPVPSRVTEGWVLPLGMLASDNPYGVAVIGAGIRLDTFQALYDTVRPGRTGRAALIRDDGIMLAGDSTQRELIGQSLSHFRLFTLLRDRDRGSYVSAAPNDGIWRVISYARVRGQPLIVRIGLEIEEVLEPWWEKAQIAIGFLVAALLLVGFVSAWIVALLRTRERESARLRAALQAAESANLAKSDFLAKMSHELRTPLNAILGFSEVIKDALFGPLSTRYRDYANDIHRSGRHLLTLINDILDISRIEAGALKLNEEPVDAAATIGEVIATLREQSAAANVVVTMAVEPDLPMLMADLRAVRQMLLNLGSNAIKFTPAGGHVSFAARRDGVGLELRVRDTGVGIAPDDLAHVTEPFGRGTSQIAAGVEGTGLGLPITKSLVEAHGGRLTITSAPGEGTTVSLFFPQSRVLRDVRATRNAAAALS
jgi:signal transduction histidine kinase